MKPALSFTLGFILVLLVSSAAYVFFGFGKDDTIYLKDTLNTPPDETVPGALTASTTADTSNATTSSSTSTETAPTSGKSQSVGN